METPYCFQYRKTDQAPKDATIGVTISDRKEPDVCDACGTRIPRGVEYVLPRYFDLSEKPFQDAPAVCMPCARVKGWVVYADLR